MADIAIEHRAEDIEAGFRVAMRRLASTVSVVTTADADGWHGITTTAVTSVCAAPPSLLVCINQSASIYSRLRINAAFCVNLLRSSHVDVSKVFGGQSNGVERFGHGRWAEERGLPYLIDAQANLFCATEQIHRFGTHGIFIGRIVSIRTAGAVGPLIYQDGKYVTTAAAE
jgi:flavin reductase